MRAWLFVGGGVVIVVAVAIAFWVGDRPTPDPAAQDTVTEAPAVSDAPAASDDQGVAELAPEDDAAEASAGQLAVEELPAPDVDQTPAEARSEAEPVEGDAAAEQGAGDQLAATDTPPNQPEGEIEAAETVPDQVAETVEQPPIGAAPGAAETDGESSVVESSEGHLAEAGETETVAGGASPATDAPLAESSDGQSAAAVETETVAGEPTPATDAPTAEAQSDMPDVADQGTAISEQTVEAPETVGAVEGAEAVDARPAEAPAVVTDDATPGPVAGLSPPGAAIETQEPAEQGASDRDGGTETLDQPAPATDTVALDVGPEPPSFDAVRVNENGMIIIAGRAEPGATVIITDNGEQIGMVEADDLGEFVFIGSQPLSPGDHEVGLEAFMADNPETVTPSSRIVLLVVPEPGLTVADTAPAQDGSGEGDTGALAVLVDRNEVAPTEVLQAPTAPTTETSDAAAELSVERPSAVDAVPENGPTADTGGLVVSIDVVDYDDNGRLIVAGRALPGAIIIIYLDNRPVGQTVAAADGRYWLRPDEPVAPGLYTLRADQIGDGGSVVARAETPFQRTAPLADIPDNRQIIVQPGNNLWRLARRIYGQGLQYTVIYQANRDQIRNPDLIYPGQVFELPAPPQQLPAGVPSRI